MSRNVAEAPVKIMLCLNAQKLNKLPGQNHGTRLFTIAFQIKIHLKKSILFMIMIVYLQTG